MKKLMILFLCVMGVISSIAQADETRNSPYFTSNGLDEDGGSILHWQASICGCENYYELIEKMRQEAGTGPLIVNILHKNNNGQTAGDIARLNYAATKVKRCETMGIHHKGLMEYIGAKATYGELL